MKLFTVEHPVLLLLLLWNGHLGHWISSTLSHGLRNAYVCLYVCTIKHTQSSPHGTKNRRTHKLQNCTLCKHGCV